MGTVSKDQYKVGEVSAVLNQTIVDKELTFINYLKSGGALENKKDFIFEVLQTRHKRRIAGVKAFGATASTIRKDVGQKIMATQMHKKEEDSVKESDLIQGLIVDPKTGKPATKAQAIAASRAIVKDKCLSRDEMSMCAIVTTPNHGQDVTIAGIDDLPVANDWQVPAANSFTATIPWDSSGANPGKDLARAVAIMNTAGITDIVVFYSTNTGSVIHDLIKRNALTVDQKMLSELTWKLQGIVPDGVFGLRWGVHNLMYNDATETEQQMFPDGQIALLPVKASQAFRYYQGLNMINGAHGFGGREWKDEKNDATVTEGDIVSLAACTNPWGIVTINIYTP